MSDLVQLTNADASALEDINLLLRQLSTRVPLCTLELLQNITESPGVELWVVQEGKKIVGMGEVAIVLKPEGIIAQIEDVIVDEGQRGKGLGKQILQKLIDRARARGARTIKLSSNASRVAANALYQKFGFKIHETNSYFLNV